RGPGDVDRRVASAALLERMVPALARPSARESAQPSRRRLARPNDRQSLRHRHGPDHAADSQQLPPDPAKIAMRMTTSNKCPALYSDRNSQFSIFNFQFSIPFGLVASVTACILSALPFSARAASPQFEIQTNDTKAKIAGIQQMLGNDSILTLSDDS